MSAGRIQALLIATRSGRVVYERFYDSFSELEKAEIRAAFSDTADDESVGDGQEHVGRHKNGKIVGIPSGQLVFFGLGTGEYNELAVSEILQTIIGVYKDIFKATELTDALLLQNYPQTIIVIDEVCREGIPEHMDKPSIIKALAFKLPVFTYEGPETRGSGFMSRFSM